MRRPRITHLAVMAAAWSAAPLAFGQQFTLDGAGTLPGFQKPTGAVREGISYPGMLRAPTGVGILASSTWIGGNDTGVFNSCGTQTATNFAGSWNDPNVWLGGTVPTGGGVALIGQPADGLGDISIVMDGPSPTLTSVTMTNNRGVEYQPGGG